MNKYISRLIQQSIKQFKLDLSGLNILVPAHPKEPCLLPLIAKMAQAQSIYVQSYDIDALNKISAYLLAYQEETNIESNITFIEKETSQILSSLDIIIKGDEISEIDSKYLNSLKSDCVISVYPENLDFFNIKGVNLQECSRKRIPVIAVKPDDSNLMLYKYLSQIVLKRCNEINLDLFRSKIILVGSGELLENTLGLLKACGTNVYATNLDKMNDKAYILKHLPDTDAIVVIDYPKKHNLIIGTQGFITIEDILDLNPDIKIIHLSGNIQENALFLGKIFYTPDKIRQNTLNINPEELGLRAIIDSSVAAMKAAEALIKIKNRTVLSNESVISYEIVNTDGPIVLGRTMF